MILRYLEGLTADETAARLGLTPKAAAKRARGIAGLRAALASKGHGSAEVGLAGVLAVEAATALPEAVSAGLMEAVVGGSAGASATALSAATGKAMAMAKVKVVAAWVGGVVLVGVGVGLVAGPEPAKAPQVAQAGPPATAPAPVAQKDDADASPRVYRHELLIDQGLCTAILKEATRVPSEGQWEAYRMPTAKLREWLIGAPKGRVLYSFEHGPSMATPEKAANQDRSGFSNFYMFGATIMADRPYLQAVMRGVIQDRVWADGMGVHFPLKDNDWKVEISGVPGGQITRSGKLSADAVLQVDETLMAVLKVGELAMGRTAWSWRWTCSMPRTSRRGTSRNCASRNSGHSLARRCAAGSRITLRSGAAAGISPRRPRRSGRESSAMGQSCGWRR